MSSSWQTTRRRLKWCCCLIAVFPVIWEMSPLSTIQNLSSEKEFLFSRLGEGDQPSVETGGGGVFTSLVVDALEGGAANLLGAVSAPAIYAFVEAALGAWDRHSAFSYPNAADSSTALHSSMRAQDHCAIISIDGIKSSG